jgi:hypothetical protein
LIINYGEATPHFCIFTFGERVMKIEIPEYTTSEFENLLYPIFEVPENKSIITFLKKELDYPEFHVQLDNYGFIGWKGRNKVLKYIACVYDMFSPFNEFKDVNKRKYTAALFLGFEIDDDGKFPFEVEQMMACQIDPIVDMIVRYTRNHHEPEWAYLKAVEDRYYKMIKFVHNEEIVKFSDLKEMKNEINETQKLILAKDKSRNLETQLYDHMDMDRIELRPEDIAQKIRDKNGKQGVSTKSEEAIS